MEGSVKHHRQRRGRDGGERFVVSMTFPMEFLKIGPKGVYLNELITSGPCFKFARGGGNTGDPTYLVKRERCSGIGGENFWV